MRRRPFLLQIAHTHKKKIPLHQCVTVCVSRLLLYTLQSVGKYHFLGGNFFTLFVSTFRGDFVSFFFGSTGSKKAAKTTMSNIPR